MDNQSRFCGHCGRPLGGNERFCAGCGTPVSQPIVQTPVQPIQPIQPTQPVATPVMQPNMQTPVSQPVVQRIMPERPKKSKKKIIMWSSVSAGVLLVVLILVLVITQITRVKDRTIMVYMIGSNLESEGAAASIDINEMKETSFDQEHTKLLIYTGGSKKWTLDEISPDENAVFEVKDGQLIKQQTFKKSVMTDPEGIIEFVNYAYENYSADLYDLILWDHGGGPIFGYGMDEYSLTEAPMKIPTLTKALSDTKLIGSGKKFDFVGFDACLMGSLEVAKALSSYSDYMIASEELEPGDGWNYKFLNELGGEEPLRDTKEIGTKVVDYFITQYDDYDKEVDLSLSMVDLSKVNQLTKSLDALFGDVKEGIDRSTFSRYARTMTRKTVYGYTGRNDESYDLVDVLDLTQSLQEDYGDKVATIKNDLEDMVIHSRSNMDNTNGLSMYFLNYNKECADELLAAYKDVAFSDVYYDFLSKYKMFVTGEKYVKRAVYSDLREEKQDGAISVELTDELRDNYQSGEIIIFRKLGENRFMPVYRGSDVQLNGNTLSTTSTNLQFVIEITGKDGTDYGWTALYEKERTKDYADYVAFGVLWYDDGGSIGLGSKSYDMYIRIPNGSTEGQVRDIKVQSENELASKASFAPEKIKIIEFVIGSYKLYNDAGELDYNMESYRTPEGGLKLYGAGANLEEGDDYKIKLVGLDFDFGDMYADEFNNLYDFYAGFIVHDTQGESHRLNLIHIDK